MCGACEQKKREEARRLEALNASGRHHVQSSHVRADSRYSNDPTIGCMVKLGMLQELEKKVVSLYKSRDVDNPLRAKFLGIQKMIRDWIVNLKSDCPDEELLEDTVTMINNEYAKYYPSE